MPQNGMYAPPRAATEYQGWRIHRGFFAMLAMRGSKHAGILYPEVAHMPQNGMYAPPRAATEYQGWRIHRVFCDVCDEELQARRHSIAGGRTHATKRHVCATHRRRAH